MVDSELRQTFTLDRHDFRRFLSAMLLQDRTFKDLLWFSTLSVVVSLSIFGALKLWWADYPGAIVYFSVALVWFLAWPPCMILWNILRIQKKRKDFPLGDYTLILADAHITLQHGRRSIRTNDERIRETRHLFLFSTASLQVFFLPKEKLNPEVLQRLRTLATKKTETR
jgi:hypothetical protein